MIENVNIFNRVEGKKFSQKEIKYIDFSVLTGN